MTPFPTDTLKRATLALLALALIASAFAPFDRTTWLLEVFPILVGAPLLLWFDRRDGVTQILFVLIMLHGLVLIWGGAYTYARVPLGFWMQEWFGFARNNYDRIGHFMQGFVPALITREVLVRAARSAHRQSPLPGVLVCLRGDGDQRVLRAD
ncbi:MAG: hypothetical protein JWN94_4401 [Betaproteobacteria bacterium]|nr:hypothetical protein [Betaproteobacteria bacterium]